MGDCDESSNMASNHARIATCDVASRIAVRLRHPRD